MNETPASSSRAASAVAESSRQHTDSPTSSSNEHASSRSNKEGARPGSNDLLLPSTYAKDYPEDDSEPSSQRWLQVFVRLRTMLECKVSCLRLPVGALSSIRRIA